ncbi:YciI family protein [Hansschlegelia beijingensis]
MRFMIIRKADADTEAGKMPSEALLQAMGDYNKQMLDAGVIVTGEGLKPTSAGARVRLSRDGTPPVVTDGPFAESKELVAGFTIIEVASKDEALDWVRRWPREDAPVELELRQVYELSDFPVDPAEAPDGWRAMEQAARDREGGR